MTVQENSLKIHSLDFPATHTRHPSPPTPSIHPFITASCCTLFSSRPLPQHLSSTIMSIPRHPPPLIPRPHAALENLEYGSYSTFFLLYFLTVYEATEFQEHNKETKKNIRWKQTKEQKSQRTPVSNILFPSCDILHRSGCSVVF